MLVEITNLELYTHHRHIWLQIVLLFVHIFTLKWDTKPWHVGLLFSCGYVLAMNESW